mgnify:CR=1 FL=1
MDGKSQNITEEQINRLKELFPEVFTEGKIDWNRLKATLGDHVDLGERYGLSWKGKSGVFAKIQEQTIATLHPQPEESVDWDTTQNMFIEGDNLEALKVLHKAYYGKVKMIYIDPPYNTGNDFVYNDDFKQARREYETEAGIVDEEGNITRDDGLRVNSGGHKHSNWLNMMYPRLFLARNLLRQDGVIFVSIDDNEVHNLRLIMDEIFGEENFVAEIVWEKRFTRSNNAKMFATLTERVLLYRRSNAVESLKDIRDENNSSSFSNPDNDPRGDWTSVSYVNPASKSARPNLSYEIINPITGEKIIHPTNAWKYSHEVYKKHAAENRLWWGKNGENTYPRLKRFLSEMNEGVVPVDLWKHTETGTTDQASKDLEALIGRGIFDFPKPVGLLKKMMRIITEPDAEDIVLDFFSGSGTLAHAVMELNAEDGGNRKWICVQLPELTGEKSEAYKAGYKTIAEIARERIRRAAKKIAEDHKDKIAQRETPLDLGFRAYVLGDSNFKKWNELVSDPEEIRTQIFDHIDPIEPGAKDEDLLTEILLKRGISPLAKIEQHDGFVFVPDENLAISLARNMTEELFKSMLAKNPSQIIILDVAFNNDLNLKTNLVLQSEKQNTGLEIL